MASLIEIWFFPQGFEIFQTDRLDYFDKSIIKLYLLSNIIDFFFIVLLLKDVWTSKLADSLSFQRINSTIPLDTTQILRTSFRKIILRSGSLIIPRLCLIFPMNDCFVLLKNTYITLVICRFFNILAKKWIKYFSCIHTSFEYQNTMCMSKKSHRDETRTKFFCLLFFFSFQA